MVYIDTIFVVNLLVTSNTLHTLSFDFYRVRAKCSIGDPVHDTLKFSRRKKTDSNNDSIQKGKFKRKEKFNANLLKHVATVPSETVHALRTPLPPPLVSL